MLGHEPCLHELALDVVARAPVHAPDGVGVVCAADGEDDEVPAEPQAEEG